MIRPTNGETEHIAEQDPALSEGQGETKPKAWPAWCGRFLKALAIHGVVLEACRNASVARAHAYRTRQEIPEFAEAWESAIQDANDELELICIKEAMERHPEKVPTTMRIFMLKGRKPEYRDAKEFHTHVNVPAAEKELRFS